MECYWLYHFETSGPYESFSRRCLPFGTLERIMHLDDNPAYVLMDNQWQKLPQAFCTGLYREMAHWKAVGTIRKFGIRRKHGRFRKVPFVQEQVIANWKQHRHGCLSSIRPS